MGKQLVLDALQNRETERVPWVPFVGCHAASLLGISAEEYFKSADHIVAGVKKAYELYRPDGLPVLFDLQVEAEALGCGVRYEPGNPPAVISHPMEEGVALSALRIPDATEGRFPVVLEAMRRVRAELGDEIAVYGLITGPFTLALHLRGTDIFYEMSDEDEGMEPLMAFCRDVCIHTAKLYMDAGCDVIAVVDPMVSQISPDMFEDYVQPAATAVFDSIHAAGKLGSFFVCGNAKRVIPNMVECHCDNISFDENIPLEYVRDIAHAKGVSVGGNLRLTVVMLFGTPMDNIEEARNCIAIGGTKGYVLSPGCDMPFATPPENVQAVAAVVYGEDGEFIGQAGGLEGIEVEIPDYAALKEVRVDVVTLDSTSCAPCQYMMEAVMAAVAPLGEQTTVFEHKIKEKESVVFMIRSGVRNIPTILIDGKIAYESLIPPVEELQAAVQAAIDAKRV